MSTLPRHELSLSIFLLISAGGCSGYVSVGGGSGDDQALGSGGGHTSGTGSGQASGSGGAQASSSSSVDPDSGSPGPMCGAITASGLSVCPSQWTPETNDQLPCNMPKGTACVFPEAGKWTACVCSCREEHVFECAGYSTASICPATEPVQGSSCTENANCAYYPSTLCKCDAQGSWQCYPDDTPWNCPNVLSKVPPAPSGMTPDQPVRDLSEADMQAWCTWYMNDFPPGNLPAPTPLYDNGYVWGGSTIFRYVGPCIQHLSVDHCVANLKLTKCDATIGQVEDCVRTLWNENLLVGHGCISLQQCGCDDTIVQFSDLPNSTCKVPIQ